MRNYDPMSGEILIDNLNLKTIIKIISEKIFLMFLKNFLFSDKLKIIFALVKMMLKCPK